MEPRINLVLLVVDNSDPNWKVPCGLKRLYAKHPAACSLANRCPLSSHESSANSGRCLVSGAPADGNSEGRGAPSLASECVSRVFSLACLFLAAWGCQVCNKGFCILVPLVLRPKSWRWNHGHHPCFTRRTLRHTEVNLPKVTGYSAGSRDSSQGSNHTDALPHPQIWSWASQVRVICHLSGDGAGCPVEGP